MKNLDALKERFGEIYEINVGDKQCILRKPLTIEFFSFMDIKNGETDLDEYYTKIVDTLWIEGDEEIKTNDQYFISLCNNLEDLIFDIGSCTMQQEDGLFIFKFENKYIMKVKPIDRKTFFKVKGLMGQNSYMALMEIKNKCLEYMDVELKDKNYEVIILLSLTRIIKHKDITLKKK